MGEYKYLWQFYWDCGRSGSLDGLFVATESEVKSVIGQDAYFGEVLGKHSEIYGTIDEGDITKVDLHPDIVETVAKILGDTWSGFNPLEYVRAYYDCHYCGNSCREDEFDSDHQACYDCIEELEQENEEKDEENE